MKYGEKEFVVKSFHRPNLINRFVYGIFRPSKAKRSYIHAGMFLEIGVGTPRPVVISMYVAEDCLTEVTM